MSRSVAEVVAYIDSIVGSRDDRSSSRHFHDGYHRSPEAYARNRYYEHGHSQVYDRYPRERDEKKLPLQFHFDEQRRVEKEKLEKARQEELSKEQLLAKQNCSELRKTEEMLKEIEKTLHDQNLFFKKLKDEKMERERLEREEQRLWQERKLKEQRLQLEKLEQQVRLEKERVEHERQVRELRREREEQMVRQEKKLKEQRLQLEKLEQVRLKEERVEHERRIREELRQERERLELQKKIDRENWLQEVRRLTQEELENRVVKDSRSLESTSEGQLPPEGPEDFLEECFDVFHEMESVGPVELSREEEEIHRESPTEDIEDDVLPNLFSEVVCFHEPGVSDVFPEPESLCMSDDFDIEVDDDVREMCISDKLSQNEFTSVARSHDEEHFEDDVISGKPVCDKMSFVWLVFLLWWNFFENKASILLRKYVDEEPSCHVHYRNAFDTSPIIADYDYDRVFIPILVNCKKIGERMFLLHNLKSKKKKI